MDAICPELVLYSQIRRNNTDLIIYLAISSLISFHLESVVGRVPGPFLIILVFIEFTQTPNLIKIILSTFLHHIGHHRFYTDKSLGDTSDIISDSSGVGTASSDSTACSIGHPNMTVVCMIPYTKNYPGHLAIQQGDVIDVFGSTDCGHLEGQIRGTNRVGLFPIQYVQEVNFRQKNISNVSAAPSQQQQHQHLQQQQQQQHHYMDEMMSSAGGHGHMDSAQQSDYNVLNNNNANNNNNNTVLNSSEMFHNNSNHQNGAAQQYSSLTAPRVKRM